MAIAGGAWYLTSRRKQVAAIASGRPARGGLAAGAARHAHTDASSGSRPTAAGSGPRLPAAKPPVPQPRADQDANPADDIQAASTRVPLDAATKAQVQDIWRQAAALMKKGDFDGAAAQYQRLARLRPGWAPAIAALGAALAAKGSSAGRRSRKTL